MDVSQSLPLFFLLLSLGLMYGFIERWVLPYIHRRSLPSTNATLSTVARFARHRFAHSSQYKEDLARWKATIAEMGLSEKDVKGATKRKDGSTGGGSAMKKQKKIESMFNKVVKRKSGWEGDNGAWGEEQFDFWYVLTFLPDLQWCHLAPLRAVGVFDSKVRLRVAREIFLHAFFGFTTTILPLHFGRSFTPPLTPRS